METRKVNNRLPIAWEGLPFVIAGAALTALFFILDSPFLAIVLALLTLFTGYFFRGPDRNLVDQEKAVLTPADGRILKGDIELHSRTGDWRNHGHHRNPGYNKVILQVVWDGSGRAVLQSGKAVPTVRLRPFLDGALDEVRRLLSQPDVPSEPCHNAEQRLGSGELGKLLDEAGEARFRLKADSFAAKLEEESPSQVMYEGVMEALGYTKNKQAFEELAQRLRFAVLESSCKGKSYSERVTLLKALLLGAAGLLSGDESGELERIWTCMGNKEMMSSSVWRMFRVRPGNHPVHRLTGAAYLLARFIEEGELFQSVLQLIGESTSGTAQLEAGFVVRDTVTPPCKRNTLIGQGRARDIVINVVLPLTFAWAEVNGQIELIERVSELYRDCPKVDENELTRGLATLLRKPGAPCFVDTARRQQGLIHLTKTFCRQRRCADCPVFKKLNTVSLAC